jgi:hypothetical protein
MPMNPAIIAVAACMCCMVLVVVIYFAMQSPSPAPSPVETPSAATPLAGTPSTGTPPVGASPSSTTSAPIIPVVVNPPAVAAAPPPPAVPTPNPYITIPSPPPPAPSVRGFVSIQTVNRPVNITPNSPTAPTAGDVGVSDGTPISQWNVPNLKTAAYLRFSDGNIMKVRNIAYYNFYGYFISETGAQRASPYATTTRFANFQLGNFYP